MVQVFSNSHYLCTPHTSDELIYRTMKIHIRYRYFLTPKYLRKCQTVSEKYIKISKNGRHFDTIGYIENTILRRRYSTLALTIISKSAIYRDNCDLSTHHYHSHRATVDTAIKPQGKIVTKDHLEKKSRRK